MNRLVPVAALAFATDHGLNDFVTLLSMALLGRFGPQWQDAISEAYRASRFTAKQIVLFLLAWPHDRATWVYAESLGADIEREFWRSKAPWGLKGDNGDVEYAVEHYLQADRSEFVVEGLYPKMRPRTPPPCWSIRFSLVDSRLIDGGRC